MLIAKDFIIAYEKFNDEELVRIHSIIDSYGKEAQKALAVVLKNKGGIEAILGRVEEKKRIAAEVERILSAVKAQDSTAIDSQFTKKMVTSSFLPEEKVMEIIENRYVEEKVVRTFIKPQKKSSFLGFFQKK